MTLIISTNQYDLTNAINNFRHAYHVDYFCVRGHAKIYLATSAPTPITTTPLAMALHGVLGRWGAGTRKAPKLQSLINFQTALNCPQLHLLLRTIAGATPSLTSFNTRCLNGSISPVTLSTFDHDLLSALNCLASSLLVSNTNVTYPMKALLLITGFMPAFDSQVRAGLAIGGFVSCNKTSWLLPGIGSTIADAKKITRIPFYIADCYKKNKLLIDCAVAASRYPHLAGEIGRIFDILFFKQTKSAPILLSLIPPAKKWYAIP